MLKQLSVLEDPTLETQIMLRIFGQLMNSFKKEKYLVSYLLPRQEGHWIDKSILLIAGLRAMGIPARLHLAKVKNHIAAEKLIAKIGTNELTPHGMVDIFLNAKLIKVSPAFNATLCERYKVEPLGFDGEQLPPNNGR